MMLTFLELAYMVDATQDDGVGYTSHSYQNADGSVDTLTVIS